MYPRPICAPVDGCLCNDVWCAVRAVRDLQSSTEQQPSRVLGLKVKGMVVRAKKEHEIILDIVAKLVNGGPVRVRKEHVRIVNHEGIIVVRGGICCGRPESC